MESFKKEMIDLIEKLNKATFEYDKGKSSISDKEWDDMYFKLTRLEKETGIILPNSPTQKINYEIVSELKKVKHNHPMLSLDKTKDIKEVKSFLKGHDWIAMAKMDGLTCSLRYIDGELISAETRGNGVEGEDITHNAKVIQSIPNHINSKGELIVDGEIICTYNDFKPFEDTYKNPRNFAAGSIRLLNSKECYNRNLTFVAWDIIKGGPHKFLSQNLAWIATQKFYITPCFINKNTSLDEVIQIIKKRSQSLSFPIDGVVFKYDAISDYNAAGRTDHHFKGGLAYKFYDETYETKLINIEWSMSRLGQLSPIAVFETLNIDGTEISKASLSNLTIMKKTLGEYPFKGQILEISKRNQIIPKIERAKGEDGKWII